eukprot:3500795-Amphidinium_carterae.1
MAQASKYDVRHVVPYKDLCSHFVLRKASAFAKMFTLQLQPLRKYIGKNSEECTEIHSPTMPFALLDLQTLVVDGIQSEQ